MLLSRAFQLWREGGQKHELEFAHGLEEGIQKNGVICPDVVLLDLVLDDSRDPLKTAAAIPRFAAAPGCRPPAVIVLTAMEKGEILTACFAHGAEAYVPKGVLPKSPDMLFMAILNACLRREHRPKTTYGTD